ncbi:glycosyltransferase [Bifidobacterium pseudolongum]|uniref:glycosyltransferase n=1 Tax=Bifidobacterium pseudolongum TaxID=1694 RepID=UPI001F5C56AE|nr:glycosyltransferase [Bifidobacterium pseudolongum]
MAQPVAIGLNRTLQCNQTKRSRPLRIQIFVFSHDGGCHTCCNINHCMSAENMCQAPAIDKIKESSVSDTSNQNEISYAAPIQSIINSAARLAPNLQPHCNNTSPKTGNNKDTSLCSLRKMPWLPWIIALIVVAIIEIGFFNLGYWRTHQLPAVTQGAPEVGAGLRSLGNDEYEIIKPSEATITVPISSASDAGPVYVGSVRVMENTSPDTQQVAFAIKTPGKDGRWVDARESDGAWEAPRHTLWYSNLPSSQMLLFGTKRSIYEGVSARITFLGDQGLKVAFSGMQVNATIPFTINSIRLCMELIAAAFFVVFRPSSRIYRMRVNTKSARQNIALAIYILACTATLTYIARLTNTHVFESLGNFWIDTEQYQRLGDALIRGHTWLDLPVDPQLANMPNPYSFYDRTELVQQHGMQYFWDHAYYDGHYYCYFGVVPAVLLFVPFQLLTGEWMPTWLALGVFFAIASLFGTLLVRTMAQKYFPNTSLGIIWLSIIGLGLGTNLFTYARRSDFYGIPITAAIAFVFAGLWFWIKSKREDGTVSIPLVMAGSFCMALLLGTRPQFLAAWVLAFPIFWDEIFQRRTLFSRMGFGATVSAIAPFAVVAVPILAYNYVRFHSILNFGQSYNLTGYDMTSRHASPYLMPRVLFNALFQPISTCSEFPFITMVDTYVEAPNEPSLGGYFAVAPIAIFALFTWIVRRQLANHNVWGIAITTVTVACIVVFVDSYISGTTMRYYGDSGYLFILAAILTIFAYANSDSLYDTNFAQETLNTGAVSSIGLRTLIVVVEIAVCITAIITFLGMFTQGLLGSWNNQIPALFDEVKSWFIGLTA